MDYNKVHTLFLLIKTSDGKVHTFTKDTEYWNYDDHIFISLDADQWIDIYYSQIIYKAFTNDSDF